MTTQNTAAHTPGPWHVNSTEAHGEACSYAALIIGAESAGSPCVASLEFGGTIETDSETTKANARLIAAAPELLAALEGMIALSGLRTDIPLEKMPKRLQVAVSAIAKATK